MQHFDDKYVLGKWLGEGQFSTVYECFIKKNDEESKEESKVPFTEKFTVKVTRNHEEEIINASKKEFEVLKRLNHPNVVHGIDFFLNEHKQEVHSVMNYIEDSTDICEKISTLGKYREIDA